MITLAVTILLIVLFLVLTRKQRSEYYEEGIGPSDIEMGPSEDAPVRPRSLVHKIKKGIKKNRRETNTRCGTSRSVFKTDRYESS